MRLKFQRQRLHPATTLCTNYLVWRDHDIVKVHKIRYDDLGHSSDLVFLSDMITPSDLQITGYQIIDGKLFIAYDEQVISYKLENQMYLGYTEIDLENFENKIHRIGDMLLVTPTGNLLKSQISGDLSPLWESSIKMFNFCFNPALGKGVYTNSGQIYCMKVYPERFQLTKSVSLPDTIIKIVPCQSGFMIFTNEDILKIDRDFNFIRKIPNAVYGEKLSIPHGFDSIVDDEMIDTSSNLLIYVQGHDVFLQDLNEKWSPEHIHTASYPICDISFCYPHVLLGSNSGNCFKHLYSLESSVS